MPGERRIVGSLVDCRHPVLRALAPPSPRLRCEICHLTITEEELAGAPCPECYESRGERNYAFEELPNEPPHPTRYLCEACGIVVEA